MEFLSIKTMVIVLWSLYASGVIIYNIIESVTISNIEQIKYNYSYNIINDSLNQYNYTFYNIFSNIIFALCCFLTPIMLIKYIILRDIHNCTLIMGLILYGLINGFYLFWFSYGIVIYNKCDSLSYDFCNMMFIVDMLNGIEIVMCYIFIIIFLIFSLIEKEPEKPENPNNPNNPNNPLIKIIDNNEEVNNKNNEKKNYNKPRVVNFLSM